MGCGMDIDAVVTWVDGDDLSFLAKRAEYAGRKTVPVFLDKWRAASNYTGRGELAEMRRRGRKTDEHKVIDSAKTSNRFRSNDELRYVLRSIDQNAPWIRKIYIVTNGQVPAWFDKSQSRVKIVTHEQIFPDLDNLPTFNSNAIELNIHRIPGLSEYFIYFNDDTFLGRPVQKEDFIDTMGRTKLFLESGKPLPIKMSDRSLSGHCWAFNHALLDSALPSMKRELYPHTPQIYSKRMMQEVQLVWSEECDLTQGYRFRTPFDTAMRILYIHYAGHAGTEAAPISKRKNLGVLTPIGSEEFTFVPFGDDRSDFARALEIAVMRRPMFICINDEINTDNEALTDAGRAAIQQVLGTCFPVPSVAELPSRITHAQAFEPAADCPSIATARIVAVSGASDEDLFRVVHPDDEMWSRSMAGLQVVGSHLNPGSSIVAASGAVSENLAFEFELHSDADDHEVMKGPRPPRRLLVKYPSSPEGLSFDAVILEYRRRLALLAYVRKQIAPLLEQDPTYPISHFIIADRHIRHGIVSEATINHLNTALTGGADPYSVCHRLCLAYLAVVDREKALDAARFALTSRSEGRADFITLAQGLVKIGNYLEGLCIADALCEQMPGDFESSFLRSICRFYTRGDDPEVGNLRKSKNPAALALWARVQVRNGHTGDAVANAVYSARNANPTSADLAAAAFAIFSARGDNVKALWAAGPAINEGGSRLLREVVTEEAEFGRFDASLALISVLLRTEGMREVGEELSSHIQQTRQRFEAERFEQERQQAEADRNASTLNGQQPHPHDEFTVPQAG